MAGDPLLKICIVKQVQMIVLQLCMLWSILFNVFVPLPRLPSPNYHFINRQCRWQLVFLSLEGPRASSCALRLLESPMRSKHIA